MSRIRSIKPEFFASEDVSVLPLRARLTWIGLWTHCDDHGRTKDQAKLIKAAVWPLDNVSLRDIEEDLAALAAARRIARYEWNGNRYLAVVNWHHHQRPNRPGKPKHPGTPVPTPAPGEEGHCALCWVIWAADLALKAHEPLSEDSLTVDNSIVDVVPGQRDPLTFTEDSVSPHGGLTSVGEREWERERGGESAGARDNPPPPPRCPQHLDNPTDNPCRPCGDARRTREHWDATAPMRAYQARAAETRAAADARVLAIANCGLCDNSGYAGRVLCDHDPDGPERVARHRAAIQAALPKRTPRPPQDDRSALDRLTELEPAKPSTQDPP